MYRQVQFVPVAFKAAISGIMLITLTACSSGSRTAESSMFDAFDAATGSLEDLNIKRREIPKLLEKLAANPYAPPPKMTCKSVRAELAELEPLIGPDVQPKEVEVASNSTVMSDIQNVDVVPTEDDAHNAVMGIIRSQTDFLPFRSIIRRITGADRHQRMLEEAYQAGKLRRAYLKGLAESRFGRGCLKNPISAPALTKPATDA